MKKSVKILLSAFCIMPLALCACKNYDYYKITAIASSASLGSVSGYSQEEVAEDSVVKLVARENDATKNPLLGWVKDNEYLVKVASHTEEARDNTLELNVSQGTEGQYTAVFAENESTMMYAYVKNVELLNEDEEVIPSEEYKYELSYAIMSSGSDNYFAFEDKIGEGINTNILYFGGLGQDYQFKFKVKIILPLPEPEVGELQIPLVSSTLISKDNFAENKLLTLKSTSEDVKISFNIQLSKFLTEMFQSATPEE